MSFGKRNRDGWSAVQDDIEAIEDVLAVEADSQVIGALEQVCRKKLLTEMLVPVQQDLWDKLSEAYRLGGVELMGASFNHSGMEMEDVLDLLYVAVELNAYGDEPENEDFEEALLEFLRTKSGPRMDALLAEYFGAYPSNAEPQLIRLVENPDLIKSRLNDVLEIEYDDLTQAVMNEGVGKLLELEEDHGTEDQRISYIDEQDALKYLKRLMLDETILDYFFVELINKVRSGPIMVVLMEKIIKWMENPINREIYTGGFDSIGAAVVRKLSAPGLIFTINSGAESLVDERLLALSRMKSPSKISEAALMELLMEKDDARGKKDFSYEQRSTLRNSIRANKAFKSRLMTIGILGMFQPVDFSV